MALQLWAGGEGIDDLVVMVGAGEGGAPSRDPPQVPLSPFAPGVV